MGVSTFREPRSGVRTPRAVLSWSFSLFVGLPSSRWKRGVAVLHPLVALSRASHLALAGPSASSCRVRGVCRAPLPGPAAVHRELLAVFVTGGTGRKLGLVRRTAFPRSAVGFSP